MTKKIDTIVQDIYDFMAGKGEFEEFTRDDISQFTERLTDIIYYRLKERRVKDAEKRPFTLRMSNYGTRDRKLWYEAHLGRENFQKEENPALKLNFLIGDIWECVILSLATLTGHKVECAQEEVLVNGVVGHIDAVIDGVLCDVKSASKWSFEQKFLNGGLFTGIDSFAYLPQIKGYGYAKGLDEQAFLVANKETGELALAKVPEYVNIDVPAALEHAKQVVASKEPPEERCYEDEEVSADGNRGLSKDCHFCVFKEVCWADANSGAGLRKFRYANGIKYLTHVVKPPRVEEITDEKEGYVYKEEQKTLK
jgi:hypothetical protein